MPSYKNPPFVEAICEIQFANENNEWDIMYPSQYYDIVKSKFPDKRTEKTDKIRIDIVNSGVKSTPIPQYTLLCENKDKNLFTRFSNDLLVLNTVKPYMLWDLFKENILFCFNAYIGLIKPSSFRKLSLRYINKINIGDKHSYEDMKKVFYMMPHMPDGIGILPNSMQMLIETPFVDNRDFLSIQQATLLPEPNMPSPVLFDIGYTAIDASSIKFDTFSDWLEQAHTQIENVFEKSLTDEIKSAFTL